MAQRPDERARSWERGLLRVFITHTHANREQAGDLKRALRDLAVDAFVAHDDIAPTREWENEILSALKSCDALIALLSEDARASEWVDQECGLAMARDVPIIAVDIGAVPYGFLGRYQALPGRGRGMDAIANDVFRILRSYGNTYWSLVEGLVTNLENADTFAEANARFGLLEQLAPLGLTEEHLDRIEAAYRTNDQVTYAFAAERGMEVLLGTHRAAWKQFREEERRAQEELDHG